MPISSKVLWGTWQLSFCLLHGYNVGLRRTCHPTANNDHHYSKNLFTFLHLFNLYCFCQNYLLLTLSPLTPFLDSKHHPNFSVSISLTRLKPSFRLPKEFVSPLDFKPLVHYIYFLSLANRKTWGRCSSVVEPLPSVHEALGSSLRATRGRKRRVERISMPHPWWTSKGSKSHY